jgi:MFS family permease
MPTSSSASVPAPSSAVAVGSARHIIGFVYFTFITYFSLGLPLAVLPPYVHYRMGFSAMLAGLVISVQYIATLGSRPWSGRVCDHVGAKVAVLRGMAFGTASGAVLIAAALLHTIPWLCLSVLIMSRLVLGVGQSLTAIGSILWGITSAGPSSTAKVITFNGIATYGAIAIGAPIGVVLNQRWGLVSIGLVTLLICAVSYFMASRKNPVPVHPGEHLPFAQVLGRIAPYGMSLALGGMGYSVLATFITLFFLNRHWSGAALCLTVFGATFIFTRLIFLHAIDRYGGFQVALACLAVESVAMILLWRASASWMAFAGAALSGFGFSLVFPALGVEAVKLVTERNRGAALAVFSAFADVSFFLTGPIAGAIAGAYGYSSIFIFALVCTLAALAIVVVLRQMQGVGNRE